MLFVSRQTLLAGDRLRALLSAWLLSYAPCVFIDCRAPACVCVCVWKCVCVCVCEVIHTQQFWCWSFGAELWLGLDGMRHFISCGCPVFDKVAWFDWFSWRRGRDDDAACVLRGRVFNDCTLPRRDPYTIHISYRNDSCLRISVAAVLISLSFHANLV